MPGPVSDVMGGLGNMYTGAMNAFGAGRKKRAIQEAEELKKNEEGRHFSEYWAMDRDPVYKTDLAPTPYQKTQSPAARAYLESMMTGDNVQAAQTPWANKSEVEATKASFAKRYGNQDDLIARSKAASAENPYKVKPGRELANERKTAERDEYLAEKEVLYERWDAALASGDASSVPDWYQDLIARRKTRA